MKEQMDRNAKRQACQAEEDRNAAEQKIRDDRANWLYQRLETLNEEADLFEQERDPAKNTITIMALDGEIRWLKRQLNQIEQEELERKNKESRITSMLDRLEMLNEEVDLFEQENKPENHSKIASLEMATTCVRRELRKEGYNA